MKTKQEIKELIDLQRRYMKEELSLTGGDEGKNKRIRSKYTKKIEHLKQILTYIEANPKEEHLIRDRDKLERIIESRKEHYSEWFSANKHKKNPANAFENELIKPLKNKIKTLNFILI